MATRERNEDWKMREMVSGEQRGVLVPVPKSQTGIPAMPVFPSGEESLGSVYPLLDGISPTIEWE
jgi:hypothetical protein